MGLCWMCGVTKARVFVDDRRPMTSSADTHTINFPTTDAHRDDGVGHSHAPHAASRHGGRQSHGPQVVHTPIPTYARLHGGSLSKDANEIMCCFVLLAVAACRSQRRRKPCALTASCRPCSFWCQCTRRRLAALTARFPRAPWSLGTFFRPSWYIRSLKLIRVSVHMFR